MGKSDQGKACWDLLLLSFDKFENNHSTLIEILFAAGGITYFLLTCNALLQTMPLVQIKESVPFSNKMIKGKAKLCCCRKMLQKMKQFSTPRIKVGEEIYHVVLSVDFRSLLYEGHFQEAKNSITQFF